MITTHTTAPGGAPRMLHDLMRRHLLLLCATVAVLALVLLGALVDWRLPLLIVVLAVSVVALVGVGLGVWFDTTPPFPEESQGVADVW